LTGRILPALGSSDPWFGGSATNSAFCVLAPNASPMTLDGTNTWLLGCPGSDALVVVDPGPEDDAHLAAIRDASLGVAVRAVDPEHRLGDEGLTAGSVLDFGDWTVDIVGTPGHSADSVCLLVPHDDSILTGDTVLGRGTSVVAWPDGALGPYLDSLRRLRDLADARSVSRLLPGHGPVLSDPALVLEQYLEHRMERLAEVRAVVETGVVEPASVVEIVYADVPRAVWPYAELSVRAQLDYLADQSGR
jgi:glyoxylase-like metal-dependent hydrolase (beta-lactamase superfamily II)